MPVSKKWVVKSESSKAREPRNTVLDTVDRSAGDWIPNGIAIGISESSWEEASEFFNLSEYLADGYMIEEILSPEDMYPSMYRRITNG